ncbi:MAG TPA: M17 family peptidase N-terminal domain-containing protein [Polyangia bacterium]|jgi:hypothetical protein|nr:M17 family peptidase N-terminal domain-containing protein [Polyangia bacterium]
MISFLASDLNKWDQLESAPETLVLPFFSDERPLRGAAGLCDWRLCGRLSRMLQTGRVSGASGEATLYPPGKRLPFSRLFLFGLGPASLFDEPTAKKASAAIADKVHRLTVSRYALVPPGRSTGRLSARRALEIYLEATPGSFDFLVVESLAGQKEAADLARR